MFVEQRMYTAHPGKIAAWLKLYEEIGGPCSARHVGPLLGFFTTEFGPLNRAVFLRGFDDIDDRERGLAAREADPEWARFRGESAKTGALAQQENKLLKTVGFSPIQKAGQGFTRKIGGTGMVVDHRTYDFHPGKIGGWLDAYEKMALPVQNKHLGQLLLFTVTECGPINQAVFLWAYEGLGDRDRRRTAMAADPAWGEFGRATAALGALKQQTTMVLKPTAFSPIR
ncbi:NIPSNAP family protein [Siccirubricoccus sp. G192]|uniref:NIPSNAP family protein n=1 Tax=Siccirubricoccus sp. G192 TaxID=2849651 RepID=UPI001C2BD696|nr:NIPSNAP family protein [Siccirubricoccus sp. G192]MBV1798397.1 NIPSNAP family protein [Siccirubricoccus sp. G192]